MASEDVGEYRKSVRNMSVVLAAIVITIFAALFIPPYVYPDHDVFQTSASADSPFGFTMHLQLNATVVPANGGILITGWVNSTSGSIENVTAGNDWAFPQGELWQKVCTSGWPIGLGVMQGHYTQDNYTLGKLVQIPRPLILCPVQAASPHYFLFEPHSSKALVTTAGAPAIWVIQTSLGFRGYASGILQPGVYTAVLADEWGDVLTAIFRVA